MIPNIGPLEIGVLLLVALLIFGPKRLPELGNSLGRGIREFRSTVGSRDEDGTEPAELATPSRPGETPDRG